MRFKLVFFTLVALGIPAAIFAQSAQGENSSGLKNAVILIIRHAEKGDDGHGLSSRGDARAKAYASYFKNFTIDGQAVKLDDIFASKDSRVSRTTSNCAPAPRRRWWSSPERARMVTGSHRFPACYNE
jgi:hypothetical protein